MIPGRTRHTIAIVGAGAAGTLTAIQLCETATRRRTPVDLVLVDPAPEAGRGTAYATPDPRHRLNVPAGGMSCYPDDPGHFTRWLCRHGEPAVTGTDFATRYRFGAYLADTLGQAIVRAHGVVDVRRLRTRAESCTGAPDGRVELHLADGGRVTADSAVLATGPAGSPGDWAPPALRASSRFVAAPWAAGALDGPPADTADVLLVGTGLTAVDLALSLDRPGRTVHAVSRNGLLPQPHALTPAGGMAAPEETGSSLAELRRAVYRHISRAVRTHGDWRPALDSLRPHTAQLWRSLTPEERAAFLEREGALWNTHRHRMPPATAESLSRVRTARRLRVHAGRIAATRAGQGGTVTVSLSKGREIQAGWVIDCTGPGPRLDGPLWRSLFDSGLAVPGPLGMGAATRDGRLLDADGRAERPLFTLGAPRRGELWETTAIPEIRVQAAALAQELLAPLVRPARATRRPRRRPVDGHGLATAVPTIAFSGINDLDDAYALPLVERTSPAYDGHWFHTSLLAFLRQEQGRFHEAGELAHRALAAEPASGHAVHALAHVHYESGAHEAGRDWLDAWVAGQGRGAVHRAHFSWHIALHELALDDPAAVRKRWFAQLAPGRVTGVRALVDSGSLLWRARLSDSWRGRVPAADVLDAVARDVVERPATAFTALHAAVALAAAGDLAALRRLRDHAADADPVQREVVVPLCEAFAALVEERFHEAAQGLDVLLPVLRKVGGSAAQREVVEETLLYALVAAGRCEAARRLLDARLDRKPAPRDRRLLAALPR